MLAAAAPRRPPILGAVVNVDKMRTVTDSGALPFPIGVPGPVALREPSNYAVRANLMWAATMALNDLLSRGVPGDWATHRIGHELTGLYGLDHAATLAVGTV